MRHTIEIEVEAFDVDPDDVENEVRQALTRGLPESVGLSSVERTGSW